MGSAESRPYVAGEWSPKPLAANPLSVAEKPLLPEAMTKRTVAAIVAATTWVTT